MVARSKLLSVGVQVVVLAAVGSVFVLFASGNAEARKIGDWEKVCKAKNWKTGKLEVVEERNLFMPLTQPWFARTLRLANGSWRIEYNINGMRANRVTPDAEKFVFYHECSHAQLDSASERDADCEALRQLHRDIKVTDKIIKDIEWSYLAVSRLFPTGGPCDKKESVVTPQDSPPQN